MAKKLIIDCDPGHDDAAAILLAAAHTGAFEIAAITTVCGNNTLENVTHNARVIATLLGGGYTIAAGMAHPLVSAPIISEEFHGKGGMEGPTGLPVTTAALEKEHAVEVMRRILEESPDKVLLAPLGPLTNIAVLLRMYPHLSEKIECLSLMGGGLAHGNSSAHAEFNIHVDPEAAEVVFASGVPIAMAGLDVTEQVLLYPDQYEGLRDASPLGRFFCQAMDFYNGVARRFCAAGSQMHDPTAIAWLLWPELFTGRRGRVRVTLCGEERGRTVLEEDEQGTTLVLTGGQVEEIAARIMQGIAQMCAPASKE